MAFYQRQKVLAERFEDNADVRTFWTRMGEGIEKRYNVCSTKVCG
jgi:hypothetical protein